MGHPVSDVVQEKFFLLKEPFSKVVDSFQAGGIYYHLILKNYHRYHPRNLVDPRTNYSRNRPLSLEQLAVLAWIAGSELTLSIFSFLFEYLVNTRIIEI